MQNRYVEAMRAFCEGVEEQVLRGPGSLEDPVLSVEAFLDSRRKGIGFTPLLPLMEFEPHPSNVKARCLRLRRHALGLRVPETVFEHPAIQELIAIGTDVVFMYVSYSDHSYRSTEKLSKKCQTQRRTLVLQGTGKRSLASLFVP